MIGPRAVLKFESGWGQIQEGPILRGGSPTIEFAPNPLTACLRNWRGVEVWDIETFVRFHPRAEIMHGSVMGRYSDSAERRCGGTLHPL